VEDLLIGKTTVRHCSMDEDHTALLLFSNEEQSCKADFVEERTIRSSYISSSISVA